MKIRKAKLKDAGEMSSLAINTIKSINQKNQDYSSKQIDAWKKKSSIENMKKKINKRDVFCAFEGDKLIGIISFDKERGRVYNLFVKEDYIRKGIGKKLLDFIENRAKKNKIKKLSLTSTPSAYDFYAHQNFHYIKDINLKIEGIKFKEPLMEKKI